MYHHANARLVHTYYCASTLFDDFRKSKRRFSLKNLVPISLGSPSTELQHYTFEDDLFEFEFADIELFLPISSCPETLKCT